MARRFYISCDFNERDLPEIKSLMKFLTESRYITEFAPSGSINWNYQLIEEAIERCDTFVAGVGLSYSCSTWLAHELIYAQTLSKIRMGRRRPRIFAIRLSNHNEQTWVEKSAEMYPVEWITKSEYQLLLEDYPDKI
jgi:hypothetical protein